MTFTDEWKLHIPIRGCAKKSIATKLILSQKAISKRSVVGQILFSVMYCGKENKQSSQSLPSLFSGELLPCEIVYVVLSAYFLVCCLLFLLKSSGCFFPSFPRTDDLHFSPPPFVFLWQAREERWGGEKKKLVCSFMPSKGVKRKMEPEENLPTTEETPKAARPRGRPKKVEGENPPQDPPEAEAKEHRPRGEAKEGRSMRIGRSHGKLPRQRKHRIVEAQPQDEGSGRSPEKVSLHRRRFRGVDS